MEFDGNSGEDWDLLDSLFPENNSNPTFKPDFNGSNFPLAGDASAFAADSSSSSKATHKSTPGAANNGSLAKNPHHFHQFPNEGSTCTNPFVTTGFPNELDACIPSLSFPVPDHLQGFLTDPCWDFSQPLLSSPETDQTPPPAPPPVATKVVGEGEASSADQDIVDNNNNNRRFLKSRKPNRRVKKTNSVKVQWTPVEDGWLEYFVSKYGRTRWTEFAKVLPGRVGKQCRERWHNHLRPDIKKDPWTEEEDRILIAAHRELGNKWVEIVKRLPGRTENTVKNHWNATKRRLDTRRKAKDGPAPKPSLLQTYIRSLSSASASTLTSPPPPPQHDNEKTVFETTNPESNTNPHQVQLENSGFNPTEMDYSFYANFYNDQLDQSLGSILGEGSSNGMENFELPLEMDYSLGKDSDFLV
ncbi:hypothetical protein V6N13_149357 [Hibiscus sabdariffa]|uniref:Uncharacterized protein n=1 Tax=Hibiscus sabdariffa TaxID=183260 RepID=A0ABR2EHI0_9ROSI